MICVKDILRKKPGPVWSIGPEAQVYDALQLMADKDIGALPVLDSGQLVGMFSERDYARKVVLHGRSSRETAVGQLMSFPVITVSPEESLETCMVLMTENHIRHLPVVAGDLVVGMVSIGDTLKAMIDDQRLAIRVLENYISGVPG